MYQIKKGLEQEYADYKKKNDDPYGSCTVRFADAWGTLMEKRMTKGKSFGAVAKQASHDADTEGLTGFMYGCAVSELSRFWVDGDGLRRWHNLDTQIQNEGEKANESGGVLNPALMNI